MNMKMMIIYKNSQIYLIKNTVINFSFSLFYPLVINIFPTLFRMCSIHSKNKNHGYLYKLSPIIQMIWVYYMIILILLTIV